MIVPTADRTKATVMVKVRFRKLDPRILPEMSARVAFFSTPFRLKRNGPALPWRKMPSSLAAGARWSFAWKGTGRRRRL